MLFNVLVIQDISSSLCSICILLHYVVLVFTQMVYRVLTHLHVYWLKLKLRNNKTVYFTHK